MTSAAIIWRRLDIPGHESARLGPLDGQWVLAGSAVFLNEASPCRLDYSITCTSTWETVSASVQGWIGQDEIDIAIVVDASHRWRLNGTEVPSVAGSFDLDLNFSPSTNLLPIRRLNLDVGQSAEVISAWLRFPSFRLEPLTQTYRRLARSVYRYESAGGSFLRDLTVNEAGLVTHYPGFWTVEEPT